VVAFLKAALPADLAVTMVNSLWTANHVKAFEALMGRFTSQGAANFSQAHREPAGNGALTDEQWNKMSMAERFEYSRAASTRNGRR
jgi:hypothetical protein